MTAEQPELDGLISVDERKAITVEPAVVNELSALSGENDLPLRAYEEFFARIAWSYIIEPGDSTAGKLVHSLGVVPSLGLLVTGASAKKIEDAVRMTHRDHDLDRRSLVHALKRWRPRIDRSSVVATVEAAVASGAEILTPEMTGWPAGLSDLGDHAPMLLWTKGDPGTLRSNMLAVVGARASTAYGEHVTHEIVEYGVSLGTVIVSGAAYGIDAVAHRAALSLGQQTVAVLAGGIDRYYPAGHVNLLTRIEEQGVVCAEVPPGVAPTRWRFLQRNRLIAALSQATVVTEAGIRSGSINTAGHAAQLGRRLGAVPGPITSATSTGCHRLIREYGATMIASRSDLQCLLGVPSSADSSHEGERESEVHRRVIDAMPLKQTQSSERTAQRAGLAVEDTENALLELNLLGVVRRIQQRDGRIHWKLVVPPASHIAS